MRHSFEALDSAQKEAVLSGKIAIGDAPDMVYIALGYPWRKVGERGNGMWLYKGAVGSEGQFRSTWETTPQRADQMVELRVHFRDGVVHSFETAPLNWR